MKKHRRYIPALVLTLTSVALLTVSAIIVTIGLMPKGTAAATPNLTDWISALGQALGALLTGGAVVYAARTYEKQRQDRHEESAEKRRAQSSAVTMVMAREEIEHNWNFVIRNDSPLPIFSMNVVGVADDGSHSVRHFLNPVVYGPSGSYKEYLPAVSTEEDSFVEFKDAANVEWKRYADGRLIEEKLSLGNRS